MNIQQLAKVRAEKASHLEALSGWEVSTDREEARLYAEARKAYQIAEVDFQKAICTLTNDEMHALGIAA